MTAVTEDHRRQALLAAIGALESDVLKHEQAATSARALIEQLAQLAGISGEPARPSATPAPIERAEVEGAGERGNEGGRGKRKTLGGISPKGKRADRAVDKAAKSAGVTAAFTGMKPDDAAAAAELWKCTATITESTAQESAAMRDKDTAKLTAAIETRAGAERKAGLLLISLGGRLRPLPPLISKPRSKRYRAAAELAEKAFEEKLSAAQRKAVVAISAGGANKPPAKAPAPKPKPAARHPLVPKRSNPHSFSPGVRTRLTEWKTDAEGVLSRELVAIDAKAGKASASGKNGTRPPAS
jgi:hypothetical protein